MEKNVNNIVEFPLNKPVIFDTVLFDKILDSAMQPYEGKNTDNIVEFPLNKPEIFDAAHFVTPPKNIEHKCPFCAQAIPVTQDKSRVTLATVLNDDKSMKMENGWPKNVLTLFNFPPTQYDVLVAKIKEMDKIIGKKLTKESKDI